MTDLTSNLTYYDPDNCDLSGICASLRRFVTDDFSDDSLSPARRRGEQPSSESRRVKTIPISKIGSSLWAPKIASFICSSGAGFVTGFVLRKAAMAALSVTNPVGVGLLVASMAISSLTGGCSSIVATRVALELQRKEKPKNWKVKAFIRGAAFGAVFGFIGAEFAQRSAISSSEGVTLHPVPSRPENMISYPVPPAADSDFRLLANVYGISERSIEAALNPQSSPVTVVHACQNMIYHLSYGDSASSVSKKAAHGIFEYAAQVAEKAGLDQNALGLLDPALPVLPHDALIDFLPLNVVDSMPEALQAAVLYPKNPEQILETCKAAMAHLSQNGHVESAHKVFEYGMEVADKFSLNADLYGLVAPSDVLRQEVGAVSRTTAKVLKKIFVGFGPT
ncbi:MAG: hypothetical protein AB7S81_06725 [Bdellovibrionales bacterium]